MRIRDTFARHPVLAYVGLAFAVSWGGVILTVGPTGFPGTLDEFQARLVPVVLAMLAGPSLAGLAVLVLGHGRAGLRDLWSRVSTVRVAPRWYLAAVLTAPLTVSGTLIALSAVSPAFRPGILTAADPVSHLLVGLVTGLAAGLFEELGWTGVAVPAMRRRRGVVATGLVVGLLWGAWHLLVVWWGSTASAGGMPMSVYLPAMAFSFLPPYRVLMVWVYDRTRSVGVALLMHASLTASVRIFDPIGIAGRPIVTYNLMLGVVLWLVVAVLAGRRGTTVNAANA